MIVRYLPPDLHSLHEVFEHLEGGRSVLLSLLEPCAVAPAEPSLGVYSSGSTGEPKLSWHEWPLLRQAAVDRPEWREWTWASPFRPTTYAGVQVALQAWVTKGRVLSLPADYNRAWKQLAETRPEALCCTPTFLDLLIQADAGGATGWAPRQITLGGEPTRSRAGERFRNRFPDSRFTSVYASAELGVIMKSQRLDGWYDSEQLQRRGCAWRVRDGSLEIEREGSWRNTGDLVEQVGSRLRFLGRAGSVANVAGVKVNLDAVARAAEEVEGVRVAVAYPESSLVTGQIVALRYLPEPGVDERDVQLRLEEHLRTRLRKEAWPRQFEQGPIELGANGKRRLK